MPHVQVKNIQDNILLIKIQLEKLQNDLNDLCALQESVDDQISTHTTFGFYVRKHRILANMSQRQLGELIGITQSVVGSVERGDKNPFTLRRIEQFCETIPAANLEVMKKLSERYYENRRMKMFLIQIPHRVIGWSYAHNKQEALSLLREKCPKTYSKYYSSEIEFNTAKNPWIFVEEE
jgi:transcriptional regulator with XRE-family HTH domain